jgi:hypothetical protein
MIGRKSLALAALRLATPGQLNPSCPAKSPTAGSSAGRLPPFAWNQATF